MSNKKSLLDGSMDCPESQIQHWYSATEELATNNSSRRPQTSISLKISDIAELMM